MGNQKGVVRNFLETNLPVPLTKRTSRRLGLRYDVDLILSLKSTILSVKNSILLSQQQFLTILLLTVLEKISGSPSLIRSMTKLDPRSKPEYKLLMVGFLLNQILMPKRLLLLPSLLIPITKWLGQLSSPMLSLQDRKITEQTCTP